MIRIGKCPAVLLAAIAVVGMASQTAAQNSQKSKAKMTREAAITKCVEVTQNTPAKGSVDNQIHGVAVFKACMTKLGHRP